MKNGLGRIPKSLTMLNQKKDKQEKNNAQYQEKIEQEPKIVPLAQIYQEKAKKTTQKGLPAGWTRATFIIEEKMNDKIRALAYWERLTVKEIVYEALRDYLKGKQIKPIPEKRIIIKQ
ncbi:MAG: hypothetical protein ACOYT8_01775 [Candidatus Dependentiae bacterium]